MTATYQYDPLGAELKVGAVVAFIHHHAVLGGSQPRITIGTIIARSDKTAKIDVIKMIGMEEKEGKQIRAHLEKMFVLDDDIVNRVLGAKLSI